MRCPACQVDLNENAARCPLCASPAQDAPPRIPGVSFQEYPAYKRGRRPRRPLSPWSFLPETAFALAFLLFWGGRRRGFSFAAMLSSGAALLVLWAAFALSLAILLGRRPARYLPAALCLALLGGTVFLAACVEGGAARAALPACALGLSLLNLSALRGVFRLPA